MNQAVVDEAPDAVFAALADPTRRRVLRLVAERGPTSATLLGRELPVTRQAIVKHLTVLHRRADWSRGPLCAGTRIA